ncbi:MAG: 30S ribosomal protein S20 [Phycisphaerae bacterium]|nr:MAG: 30S ribosomal protein S20 [Phycisphaerae bacterium]
MAHSLSAKKRVRQNAKRNARNKARKELLKNETKAFNAAVIKGDVDAASKALNQLVSSLDRIKTKSTLHRNTAARRRSRLTKKLNALKSKVGTQA